MGAERDVLLAAAQVAERSPSTRLAVSNAWAMLHRDGADTMYLAFAAWARVEGIPTDKVSIQSDLGKRLRARCKTPADVADSLRWAAAEEV